MDILKGFMSKYDGFIGELQYPSYLIFDNFIQISTEGLDESVETLLGCRREAENLINAVCDKEKELVLFIRGKQKSYRLVGR